MADTSASGAAERKPAARREQVRRRVLDEGFARVEDLAKVFDVSLMTMHRDLDALELDGWLVKIRGGATANPAALIEAGVKERSAAMHAEKIAVVEVAATMLTHGQTIFLDDSTTVLGLVPHLLAQPTMTVATNFVPAVELLSEGGTVDLHLLGGQYNARQQSCQGLQTVQAIDSLHADIFFMSTTAVMNGKCLHRSESTVMVRQAFLRNCTRSVLLVDHAKFGRPAPHVLCDISDFDTVITDDGIDADELAELRERCNEVLIAHVSA